LSADSVRHPLRASRRLCATCSSRPGCTWKAWCRSRRPDKLNEQLGYPRSEWHRTAGIATDHCVEPPHGLDHLALAAETAGQVGRGCRKQRRWRPGSQHWYVIEKNTNLDRLPLSYGLPVHWLLCRATTVGTARPALPNVRAKLPAEACSVSLVCEGAEGAAHQAYAACRSGSA
jgi:hypothetical protein